jgi:predicted secreted protein
MSTLRALVGQPFTLTLSENGGAGYLWALDARSAPQIMLDDQNVVNNEAAPVVSIEDQSIGGPSERTFAFRCQEVGVFYLQMRHARPWLAPGEDEGAVVQEWRVLVNPAT